MKKIKYCFAALALLAVAAWAADELTLSTGWTYNKAGRRRTLAATAAQFDIAGKYVVENVQSIGTNPAGEALYLGDVTTPGFFYAKNLDPTNFCEIGTTNGAGLFIAFLKLSTNEVALTFLGCAAPYARSGIVLTNAVNLDYVIADR